MSSRRWNVKRRLPVARELQCGQLHTHETMVIPQSFVTVQHDHGERLLSHLNRIIQHYKAKGHKYRR